MNVTRPVYTPPAGCPYLLIALSDNGRGLFARVANGDVIAVVSRGTFHVGENGTISAVEPQEDGAP